MCAKTSRQRFTLIELLVVIVILAILFAILLPTLYRVKDKTTIVLCNNNLRQLGTAFIIFAKDNDSYLPGNSGHNTGLDGSERWQKTWMGKEANFAKYDGPKGYYGTITDYTGGPEAALELYRCPGLEEGPFKTYASNGKFDYVSVQRWTGMKLNLTPKEVKYPSTLDGTKWIPAFMIMEEEPRRIPNQPNNGLNAGDSSPGFGGGDRLGTWHEQTTAYYVGFDGAVHSVQNEPFSGPGANSIRVEKPGGGETSLSGDKSWGWWNNL